MSASLLRRFLPRYSLRTLAIFLMLVTSGMGLWRRWGPWSLGWRRGLIHRPVRVEIVRSGREVRVEGPNALRDRLPAGDDTPFVRMISRLTLESGRRMPTEYVGVASPEHSPPDDRWGRGGQLVSFHTEADRARSPDGSRSVRYGGRRSGKRPACVAALRGERVVFLQELELHAAGDLSSEPPAAFTADGEGLVLAGPGWVSYYRRRRPEWWWGVFWLWEFWLAAAFAGLFIWSVLADRKSLARADAGL